MEKQPLIKQIKKIPEVNNLLEKGLTDIVIEKNLLNLISYQNKKELCKGCKGLNTCKQNYQGFKPVLSYEDETFTYEYKKCKFLEEYQKAVIKKENLHLISCNFDNYDFNDVFVNSNKENSNRIEVLTKIKEQYVAYKNNTPIRGIFLHGLYGTGKSYLLAYLATKLNDLGAVVTFAYYPDLVGQIKNAISEGNLDEIINELKETEVLFLDDFGGETVTPFIRDEILAVVLQYRMVESKLTYMSSNLSPDLITSHLSDTSRGIDFLKASRIYERIKTLMDFIELRDNNYR